MKEATALSQTVDRPIRLQLCYLVGEDVQKETVLVSHERTGPHILLRAVVPFNCGIARAPPRLRRLWTLQARSNCVSIVCG
jgi:hypothetical protein